MFGQVRYPTKLFNGQPTTYIPEPLKVVKQQGITWDNETGINPHWNKSPVKDTIYESYGEMFIRGFSPVPNSYFVNNSTPGLSVDAYNKQIKTNTKGLPGRIATVVGQWYLVDKLLTQSDALDYDYTIFRQFDTQFKLDITKKNLDFIFNDCEKDLLGNKAARNSWPLMFLMSVVSIPTPKQTGKFSNISSLFSLFYIMNRAAIALLQGRFFQLIMNEINFFAHHHGQYTKFIGGFPGALLHHIGVKNNIYQIDIYKTHLCELCYSGEVNTTDWSRSERSGY